MAELAGRVCVITGATRGIGKAVAVSFARRGAHLVLAGRSTEESPNRGGLPGTLESVAAELRALDAHVTTVAADLSRPDDVQRVADATAERHGRCDVLVNNAAVSFLGTFLEVAPRRWQPVLAVNLLAPVSLIHAFLPGMIERGDGRIVNVSSGAADTRRPGGVQQLPYSASKAGLDALSYGLANQLAGTGVAVNILAPSVFTEAVSFSVTDPELLSDMRARMTSPEAYGEAVAWVAEQPPEFTGHYLANQDLIDLGVLVGS
jgi:NAD(P)-dependent dehydrogenase (short-subunit alcohol dehydrogenase family)